MFDVRDYLKRLTAACEEYETSAPTVCAHCDDLYRRVSAIDPAVTLAEVIDVQALWAEGWMPPSYAANRVYKLRHRLGMDVTGHAGF